MRALRVPSTKDYLQPGAAVWSQIKAADVPLIATPLAMQPTEYIRKSWEGKVYGEGAKTVKVASVH
ncbi:MAG: hypothetical protein M0P39_16490, partial [Rhodocyclaceae bacterium]|nr:hypothetical protein [Rhodocyclaceae bacterium]